MLAIKTEEILARLVPREPLERFLAEVWAANRKFNLFSRQLSHKDLRMVVAESLLPVDLGWVDSDSGPALDIGSGWGIPSVPLVMACPGLDIFLVERSQKKAGFLLLLMNRLGIKATVFGDELHALDPEAKYRLITLRRVAFEKKIVDSIRNHLAPGGAVISFGPHLPELPAFSTELVSYTIDALPPRQVYRLTNL
ncbi:MAG: class I SAM-dependent methyltransferase [candidate division Zixibacteria bacterium]|nr:class I SAM-dependent methyltransferase [candidate division Zixibacteria bacterium]